MPGSDGRTATQILDCLGPTRFDIWSDNDALAGVLRSFGLGVQRNATQSWKMDASSAAAIVDLRGHAPGNYPSHEELLQSERDCLVVLTGDYNWRTLLAERAFASGWRRHPRTVLLSEGVIIVRDEGVSGRASILAETSPANYNLYALISVFIRPRSRVILVSTPQGADLVLSANTLCGSIETGSLRARSSQRGDVLVVADQETSPGDLLPLCFERLNAAGRLLHLCGGLKAARQWRSECETGKFIFERVFGVRNGIQEEIDDLESDAAYDVVLVIMMRNILSLAENDGATHFQAMPEPGVAGIFRREKKVHLDNFDAYENNGIIPGLVVRGMRITADAALENCARVVAGKVRPGSVDQGAALCVIAYQVYERGEAAAQSALLESISGWLKAAGSTPSHLRWQVSLLAVSVRLKLALGRREEALEDALACLAIDPRPYSPLLSTRIFECGFLAATMHICDGNFDAAEPILRRVIENAHTYFSGSWVDIIGSVEQPIPSGMIESSDALAIASRCGILKTHFDELRSRPGVAWQRMTWLSDLRNYRTAMDTNSLRTELHEAHRRLSAAEMALK